MGGCFNFILKAYGVMEKAGRPFLWLVFKVDFFLGRLRDEEGNCSCDILGFWRLDGCDKIRAAA